MQMMQGNHTDTADGETVPHNTNALRLDACCLFLIFTTTQSGFEIERLIRGLGALNSGLFYVCDDVAFATLLALYATQSARNVASTGELF